MGVSPGHHHQRTVMNTLIIASLGILGSVHCAGGGIAGAIEKLNSQFKYLVSSAESSIDPVIASIKSECQSDRLQTMTYGGAAGRGHPGHCGGLVWGEQATSGYSRRKPGVSIRLLGGIRYRVRGSLPASLVLGLVRV